MYALVVELVANEIEPCGQQRVCQTVADGVVQNVDRFCTHSSGQPAGT